jgi:alginate O-acetyltransferase complex protein AlgJ
MKNSGRIGKIIQCAWFLIFLFGTVLAGIFNITGEKVIQSENQVLKPGIPLSIESIEGYVKENLKNYDRHFFFRNTLIRLNNWLTVKIFNVSPVKTVILGKNNWLFQAKENLSPEEPGYFSSIQPFTFGEMEKWRISLEQRQKWLERRGIFYVFIPVPDKSTIYPEFLPDYIRSFYSHSRLDQLVQHLKKYSRLNFLDFRETLFGHKVDYLLFYRTDSHWNDQGIYFSYCEIIKFLASRIPSRKKIGALKISDFKINKTRKGLGNLARMLFFRDKRFEEIRMRLRRKTPKKWKIAGMPTSIRISKDLRPLVTVNKLADLPEAVMFHDSSGIGLRPFLSENFTRIFYIRDWDFHFRTKLIEIEKPAVVLDLISEHFLYNRQLINSKPVADAHSTPEME